MTDDSNTPSPQQPAAPGTAAVPGGLVAAVEHLVHTGPVMLGAYTIAELTVVDAIVDFLEARPPDDVLAEAVRSLAARQLLLAGSSGDQVQVRGDLGIAVAFQQRARVVLDARATGTEPGEPWRILLLPQPEDICMVVRIDALGVHQISLHTLDQSLDLLTEWLPWGPSARSLPTQDTDALLAASERSALVTVTEYTAEGSAEIAGSSTDLVLARHDGRLYALTRDPDAPDKKDTLVLSQDQDRDDVRDRLVGLLGVGAH